MSGYDDDSYFQPPNTNNPNATPYCPNGDPFITFAGRQWWINYHWTQAQGTYVWEPFKSIFDPTLVEHGPDGIRLQIQPNQDPSQAWRTSEVVLMDKLGYGKYLVTARADGGSFSDLDPHAIFGAFLYQYSEAPPSNGPNIHREIDFLEVLRSGGGNAQFTLQPYDSVVPPPVHFFQMPPGTEVITIINNWYVDPGFKIIADYSCYAGDWSLENPPPEEKLIAKWYPALDPSFAPLIPDHTDSSCERLHLNLWLMHGEAPGGPQSVTVTRFEFQPA
ncbi:hypothetical protein [Sphingomonas sp. KR3-1]|uniref:hypothetical protein n=1 Tax=Sphingomonas sp. KR3-1 TaxID=3156611 RepID=UPI0032B4A86F